MSATKTKPAPKVAALRRQIDALLSEGATDIESLGRPGDAPAGVPATAEGRPSIKLERQEGETIGQCIAKASAAPFVAGATTLGAFEKHSAVGLRSTPDDLVAELQRKAQAASDGDMTEAEGMLMVQATTLDAIFNAMAKKAAACMGTYSDTTERYMRMAFKAQAQCRTTLETLATIKAGPVVFARQANINQGGQQQINNGTAPPKPAPTRAEATGDGVKSSNELLEHSHGQRLDTGTQGARVGAHQGEEAVGQVHRPAH